MRNTLRVLAAAGVTALALGGCGAKTRPPTQKAPPPKAALPGGAQPHIAVIVMENEEYDGIVGSRSTPYINGLARALRTGDADVRDPPPITAELPGADRRLDVRDRQRLHRLQGPGHRRRRAAERRRDHAGRPTWRTCRIRASRARTPATTPRSTIRSSTTRRRPRSRQLCARRAAHARSRPTSAPERCPRSSGSRRICATTCTTAIPPSATASCPSLVPPLLRALGPRGLLMLTWDEGSSDDGCCRLASGGHIATIIAGGLARRGCTAAHVRRSLLGPADDRGPVRAAAARRRRVPVHAVAAAAASPAVVFRARWAGSGVLGAHSGSRACCSRWRFAGAANAAPTLPLGHAGRWITDARGRVVVVHGINMVYKLPPYYPDAAGFGDDDAAFLARIGFNAVRVGVIWKALEPSPGVYNDAYLAHIASTVSTLARHGVLALLDFHQDMFNERFQGEGAPDWAFRTAACRIRRSASPATTWPTSRSSTPSTSSGATRPGPAGSGSRIASPGAWAHVAARFKRSPSRARLRAVQRAVARERVWQPCLLSVGCPAFDSKLTAFYRRVSPRSAAPTRARSSGTSRTCCSTAASRPMSRASAIRAPGSRSTTTA